ncbi:MAG: HPr family phosphocarrier protein [Oscillospiraceae bacterium]|nr:HPr family phosphocarrier protein [Oscillospiraceae bacterium]
MKSYEIFLRTIIDVKNFVNAINDFDFDLDLVSGRYVVDAKSIMGIFSLDLSRPITLRVFSDDVSEVEEAISAFMFRG